MMYKYVFYLPYAILMLGAADTVLKKIHMVYSRDCYPLREPYN